MFLKIIMNILFVCTAGQQRSPTAVNVVKVNYPWHEAKFAGVHPLAEVPITPESINWADNIFVMEKMHKDFLIQNFPEEIIGKNIIILGIPDIYEKDDSELTNLLKIKLRDFLTR
jgi:protein-tyrosine phosphatase